MSPGRGWGREGKRKREGGEEKRKKDKREGERRGKRRGKDRRKAREGKGEHTTPQPQLCVLAALVPGLSTPLDLCVIL